MVGRPKGTPKTGGGSRKGIPNKTTAALKDMILGALDKAGGVEYLLKQADENPAPFLSLIGRVLPLQVTGDKENPLAVAIVALKDSLGTKLDKLVKSEGAAKTKD